ncbi:MAG: hypothetical protein IPL46_28095 [Saprospiraceae bacterium]|nr:hypothetical protein [Saprospiraceae bacterium]
MKTVKLIAGVIAFAIVSMSTSLYANDGDPETISNLRSDILKLVDGPQLGEHGIYHREVKLKFYINADQEIVVIETGTEDNYLDSFLKNRLNYHKVKYNNLKPGIYNIKITFKAS